MQTNKKGKVNDMKEDNMKQTKKRINIDVTPEFHSRLKLYAALSGMKLREYIIYAIQKEMGKCN